MRTGLAAPAAAVAAVAAIVVLVAIVGAPAAPRDPAATLGPTPTPTATPTPGSTDAASASDRPCGPTLQAEVDAAKTGATLDLRGCTYRSGATIDKPLTLVGVTVRVPAGEAGITVEANDVTLDDVTLIGAQGRTFVFDEIGVLAQATPEAPIRRLTIRNSEIASLGGFATYLRNVADVRLEGNDVHDIVYAGLMVLSGTGGTIEGNVVRRIGVEGAEANENNAYGIVLTTQGTIEPPTVDFAVIGNTVEDVPTWHAFDTHGGSRIAFRGNTVRRSMRGIFITTDEAGHEPTNIAILDNRLLSPAPIDVNLAAITLFRAHIVAITGNTATGWGEGNFLRDFEDRSTRVVVDGNTIEP